MKIIDVLDEFAQEQGIVSHAMVASYTPNEAYQIAKKAIEAYQKELQEDLIHTIQTKTVK